MPAPDAADTDEMIVVLDGALDLEDSPDTSLTDGELFVEGESRDGANPTTSDIHSQFRHNVKVTVGLQLKPSF